MSNPGEINAGVLARAIDCSYDRASRWAVPIGDAMAEFGIATPLRQAAFLAQIGHESGRLQYVHEIWNPAQCPWQARYEGRADLGNTQPGDGYRFRGRGLIQITGRANYSACGADLGLDLEAEPQLLEQPGNAARSAAWYWHTRQLNTLADAQNMRGITRAINGGLNGLAERLALYATACVALGCP
jgi:putative chitinase